MMNGKPLDRSMRDFGTTVCPPPAAASIRAGFAAVWQQTLPLTLAIGNGDGRASRARHRSSFQVVKAALALERALTRSFPHRTSAVDAAAAPNPSTGVIARALQH